MPKLKVWLLGTPRIERGDVAVQMSRRKSLALLAYLSTKAGRHSRRGLAALLWPDLEPQKANRALRRTLFSLKRAVGDEVFAVDHHALELCSESNRVWVDAGVFRAQLGACRQHGHPESEVCYRCRRPLIEAVELYRGDFLAGLDIPDASEFEEWRFLEAEAYRMETARALERLVTMLHAEGETSTAIRYARRWLAVDPLHEPAHQRLIRLYADSGQRAAALQQYEDCAKILEEQLGEAPAKETKELLLACKQDFRDPPKKREESSIPPTSREIPASSPDLSLAPHAHNLPPLSSSFLGRRNEMVEIHRLLGDSACRLLNLIGPGGIGKTSLALHAAQQELEMFPHGVYFVSLAPLSNAKLLPCAIADELPITFDGLRQPRERLLDYLRDKALLLVLDSFEHLPEGVSFLSEILRTACETKLLVTSRSRLDLKEEWLLPVEGLRFPGSGDDREVGAYSSVELFVRGAQRLRPDFRLTEANAGVVGEICRLVEGMPLALEMASAWIRALTPSEIARQIAENLDFLTTSMHDCPERHRSIRAVFEQSANLLPPEARCVLRRLSAFRGGFYQDAAQQVAGADLTSLASLVDHSLLRVGRQGRYDMHQLVRQFAVAELREEKGEWESTLERHALYHVGFLKSRHDDIRGRRQAEALSEISEEIENVRGALAWSTRHHDSTSLMRTLDTLLLFHEFKSWFEEGEQVFLRMREALARPEGAGCHEKAALEQARIDGRRGWFVFRQGRFREGEALIEGALDLFQESDARHDEALALYGLGFAAHFGGRFRSAKRRYEQSLGIAEEIGDRFLLAHVLTNLGHLVYTLGDYPRAKELCERGLEVCGETGYRHPMAYCLLKFGDIARALGNHDEATQHYREALAILSREVHYRGGIPFCLTKLGTTALDRGDYGSARTFFVKSAEVSQEIGYLPGVASSLNNLAQVAIREGECAAAERLATESLEICVRLGNRSSMAFCLSTLGDVAFDREDWDEAKKKYTASLELYEKTGYRARIASSLTKLGNVCRMLGEPEWVDEHFDRALQGAAGPEVSGSR